MSVLQMQKISIYALKSNRKRILELLQRRGAVEITDGPEPDETTFARTDTQAAQSVFQKNAALAAKALEILEGQMQQKKPLLSMLNGREPITTQEYEAHAARAQEILESAADLAALGGEIAEQNAEILRLETQAESLAPWMGLDISMRFKGTRSTTAFLGVLPENRSREDILARLGQAIPEITGIHLEVVSADPNQTCLFLLTARENAPVVESALRGMGFSYPASPSKTAPAERIEVLMERIRRAQEKISAAGEEILTFAGLREDLRFAVDYYIMRMDKYQVLGRLSQSKHVFVVTGYLPQKCAKPLCDELERDFSAAVELSDPGEGEEVPVALHNDGFANSMEPVIESYSLPGRGEVDPSSIMAVFYYIMFGMMLSDAAYGLIMTVACGVVLYKFGNLEPGMRKTMKMFFFCGISTIFWGVMFGSYFGDALDVISQTFFHTHLTIPAVWFVPVNEPMRLLVFAFLLGIIHLFTGLGIQFYQLWRAKKYKDAVYDVVFWYLLVGGGILYLLTMEMVSNMFGLGFVLPPVAGTIATACAIIGAVGIVATSGRESRNPVKRLLKGLYGLYNVSGYLSDILSYSRLLALGLATSVIATVFNKMGSMLGDSILGIIVFIVVFLVGHTMNIGINLLGAYVHTNRLQYVEFFGKFYEGGGKGFSPFRAQTKYYKFKE